MDVITVDIQRTLGLLSSMYLCKPAKDVIEGWRSALSDTTPDYSADLKKALDTIDVASEQGREDILWEYTRLFIGPYKLPCPPWESVYTSPKRLMMQTSYDDVMDAYRNEGLLMSNADVMADHIGGELNFLAVLLGRMDDEPTRRSHHACAAKTFINEHLRKWVPAFADDLEAATDHAFYRSLAKTTREIIAVIPDELLIGDSSEGA
jgi:TorA maturation chaperone TorD